MLKKLAPILLLATTLASAAAEFDKQALRVSPDDFHDFDPKQAELGRLLFYDPVLSGNQNIACGTCHNHELGTGDGLPLGIGEGGMGLGRERSAGSGADRIKKRIPRNALPLWNLGAREIKVLFHDGRLSLGDDYENGFNSPAEERLPEGLSGILAAQALFPLAAQFEMAGNPKENEVAGALHDRIDYVWPILAQRVRAIGEYGELFLAAFEDLTSVEDIDISHIANAIGAFIGLEWRSFDSPYDRWLAGDDTAMSPAAQRGQDLFYDQGNCASCHSGKFFSDQDFHALALPHFGPGRTRMFDPMVRDLGRMGESDDLADAYRFRTPMLRNVALTAPYGHNGAYATLEGIVRHHLQPRQALQAWQPTDVDLPAVPWLAAVDFVALQDRMERRRLMARVDIAPVSLSDAEVDDLIAFLNALTGSESVDGRLGKPDTVPSGLPVD